MALHVTATTNIPAAHLLIFRRSRPRYTPHPRMLPFTGQRRAGGTPKEGDMLPHRRSFTSHLPKSIASWKANEYSFKVPEFDGKNVSSVLDLTAISCQQTHPLSGPEECSNLLADQRDAFGGFRRHRRLCLLPGS